MSADKAVIRRDGTVVSKRVPRKLDRDMIDRIEAGTLAQLDEREVAHSLGLSPQTLRLWMELGENELLDEDDIYRQLWERVTSARYDLVTRAGETLARDVENEDSPTQMKSVYYTLEKLNPRFQAKTRHEHTGANGNPIAAVVVSMSKGELEAELARLRNENEGSAPEGLSLPQGDE